MGNCPSPQILNEPKSLYQSPVRSVWLRLPPHFELIKIFRGDLPLAESLEEMIPKSPRQVGPLDLRHQSPKVMRASSFFNRLCSFLSRDCVSRSASSKKRLRSRSWASRPDSIRYDEDPVGAGAVRFRQGSHPAGDAWRKAYTLTDGLFVNGHSHQNTPFHTTTLRSGRALCAAEGGGESQWLV